MATLVSPGVSVTVTDQSFFFPVSATTVPLFFIATRAGKLQTDGVSIASGTQEYGVVRTVTSQTQSLSLYGVPYFQNDISGNEYHGDARNEYGLLALNSALGIINRAYVVRANVNLDDTPESFISLGTPKAGLVSTVGIGNGTLSSITAASPAVKPQDITVTFTSSTSFGVTGSVSGHIGSGIVSAPFTSTLLNFNVTAGSVPFVNGDKFTFSLSYAAVPTVGNTGTGVVNGLRTDALAVPEVITITFDTATTFTVSNMFGPAQAGAVNVPFDDNRLNFTIATGSTAFVAGDEFTVTATNVTINNALGASDAQRRLTIVTALQAAVNSNVEVRSELYEYNLILCPGYFELADELVSLSNDVHEEAFVLADTPSNYNPDQVAQWALTSDRQSKNSVAYYYPWAVMSNLDGRNVLAAPSGVALRTIAFSDDQSYVWMAPAGVNRGLTFGVSKVGYLTGTLGTATTFVEANLNQGQRDNLYEYDKNINPITFFPGRGIIVFGQKTSSPAASALDRINVVRMVMYVRRVLRKGAMPFLFEPNDQITRDNLKAAADGILSDILTKRGLTDFATYCDGSNNTADRIDRNEMYLDVALKPTKASEFIYIPIRIVSTGATI
jgi:phage tail sheath protein FI